MRASLHNNCSSHFILQNRSLLIWMYCDATISNSEEWVLISLLGNHPLSYIIGSNPFSTKVNEMLSETSQRSRTYNNRGSFRWNMSVIHEQLRNWHKLYSVVKMTNRGKVLAAFVLLIAVIYGESVCTSDDYDEYLEHYGYKCGDDCEEYKR